MPGGPPVPAGNDSLTDAAGNALNFAPTDNMPLPGTMPAVQVGQSGTGVGSVERVGVLLANVAAVAITAGTPVSVFTPPAGKKWRVLGYHLSNSAAASIIFKDGTTSGGATESFRTPLMAAGAGQPSPNMGNGAISSTANNQLWLDSTASGNIHGYIIGMTE